MAATIVVAVRKALVAGIEDALVDQPKVSVSYGYQGGDDDRRREEIFTDRVRSTHEPAGLKTGRNFRNEQVEFDVIVRVIGVNTKPEDNDERALELGLVVEEFVADHKSNELGVEGLQWLIMTGFELANRYGPSGSMTEITYTVRYQARLT